MTKFNEDGTFYHCSDDEFICDLAGAGVCDYCGYDTVNGEFI